MKIGRYTDEEILEHLTEGEGRGFLGRSMYDAIMEEINQLTAESTKWESKFYDEAKKVDKAIEYIETHQLNFKKGTTTFGSERLSMEERKLIDILRGVDKE